MSLIDYWPTLENIETCIKSDAESALDEVLLAVHQQFPIVRQTIGSNGRVEPNSKKSCTEDELLTHLLGSAPEGSLVVPITGASGVGKSHLIRILDAKLRRLDTGKRYLIIRIPKSASLKRVVELILEADPLKDKQYDELKREFSKALTDIPLADAVIRFQGELEVALNEYVTNLRRQIDAGQDGSRINLGHAQKLPSFMSDVEVKKHFQTAVFPRVIQRSVEGISLTEDSTIDQTNSQFQIEDFEFIGINFGQAAVRVNQYYRTQLQSRGQIESAVNVLNEVVDAAIKQLYRLGQPLGGMTLAEVFLEIRRLLLNDGKDLVLFVEDFKALVGIQEALANILIVEGNPGGIPTYATIRSVIAVTDGYLGGRQTLATRSGYEWVVESALASDDETLRRTGLLVAAYLNAARHGDSVLKTHYQKISKNNDYKNIDWSPPIFKSEDDQNFLTAFGSLENIPLFPFTEQAIESLVRRSLTSDNSLLFNPRFIIKQVIREVLRAGRKAFTDGEFPSPTINSKKASAEISAWIASQQIDVDMKPRLERFVTVWGNNPDSETDLKSIPTKIFEAFKLPVPAGSIATRKKTTIESPVIPTASIKVTKPNPPNPDKEAQIRDYIASLQRWSEGNVLEQNLASLIRSNIARLINHRIDWNGERIHKSDIRNNQISIPNSIGQLGLSADKIDIASETRDESGSLRLELTSLLRNAANNNDKYEFLEDDLARIANLIDRLLDPALKLLRANSLKQTQSVISILANNSRILGLTESDSTLPSLHKFLLSKVVNVEDLASHDLTTEVHDWHQMQVNALNIRPELIIKLFSTLGCFQGEGKKVLGIDIVRLVESIPDESFKIEYENLHLIGDIAVDKDKLTSLTQRISLIRLEKLLKEIEKVQSNINSELGSKFDKNKLTSALKNLAFHVNDMGVWSHNIGFDLHCYSELCTKFTAASIKDSFAILNRISELENVTNINAKNNKLTYGGQIKLEPLLVTNQFIIDSRTLIKFCEKYVESQERTYEGINPEIKALEIKGLLTSLTDDLTYINLGND